MKRLAYIIGTWFGAGLSPVAPGTVGSLAAIPFVWYFAWQGPLPLLLFLLSTLSIGVWAADVISKDRNNPDPQIVVVDEVQGQAAAILLTTVLLPIEELRRVIDPFSLRGWAVMAVCFAMFRVFDILKPWPVSYFDRKHSPLGVMLDDTAAGLYATILTWLFVLFVR